MSKPIAKEDDLVTGQDIHIVMVPSPGGPIPTPTPLPFQAKLTTRLSTTFFVDNKAVAIEGSGGYNEPPHIAPAGPFQTPPSNRCTVEQGSSVLLIDGKGVVRVGDPAKTCNDPADAPNGTVVGSSSLFVGP